MAREIEGLEFAEVPSSNIWLAAYDAGSLYLVFRTHEHASLVTVYEFILPFDTIIKLLTAGSIGGFFARNIRGMPFHKTTHARSRIHITGKDGWP